MSTWAGLTVIGILLLALAGGFMLTGCAQQSFTATCAMQHVGTTDSGVEVFRIHCAPA